MKRGRRRRCSIKLMEQFQKRILSGSIYTRSDDAISLVRQNSNVFTSLFSSFYIFGVFPWCDEPTPQLLFKFPDVPDEIDSSLPNLCFPNQCSFRICRFKERRSFLKDHIIDDSEITSSKFVPMYFPEDTDDPYMFCTYVNVSPLTVPSFAHSYAFSELLDMVKSDSMKMSMVCLAFKTKLPFHELFRNLGRWILQSELVTRFGRSVDIFSEDGGRIDREMWAQFQAQRASIRSAIEALYRLPVPIQGNSLEYESESALIPSFRWERPLVTDAANHLMLAQEAVRVLMKFIPKKRFAALFFSLFLEKKILVHSVDMQYVCWAVLALHFLLRPLCWVCGSVSSLPRMLEDLLDSPNPMIFGLNFVAAADEPDNVYVDLAKRSVVAPAYPEPPFRREFADGVNSIWEKEGAPALLLQHCNDYVQRVISSVQMCIMTNFTDPVHVNSIFMSELFLGHFKPEERGFCSELKDTQMFTFYVEQECRKKSDQMVFQ